MCVMMIIQDFLSWLNTASDGPRAEAAGALARAWLFSDMDAESQHGAGAALTLLLEDPCLDVRLALAQALGRSEDAPRHIILALAYDCCEIAETVCRLSPILSDGELIDVLGHPDTAVHAAVASRASVSAPLAAAIAEVCGQDACTALIGNTGARLLPGTLVRLARRFACVDDIRNHLLERADLPIDIRHELLLAHVIALNAQATGAEHPASLSSENLLSDASDRFALRLAQTADLADLSVLAASLRDRSMLHTRLLLRAVCCGKFRFFNVALSLLSGLSGDRLSALLQTARPSALRAVLRKAGLPLRTHQAFMLAIDMLREADTDISQDLPFDIAKAFSEALVAELQDEALGADGDILAFLRRFSLEAARLEARAYLKGNVQKALSQRTLSAA